MGRKLGCANEIAYRIANIVIEKADLSNLFGFFCKNAIELGLRLLYNKDAKIKYFSI